MSRVRALVATVSLFVLLASTACASSSEPTGSPLSKGPATTVRVLGTWSDKELDDFLTVVAPYEQRTGVRILYTGTRDLRGVLDDALRRGDPPDIAGLAGPGHMNELARAGALRDLSATIDMQPYRQNVAPTFVELGRVGNRLVGVFVKATMKGLIWYNPAVVRRGSPTTLEELLHLAGMGASETTREWCVGLESKEASGWPGTDWVESVVLRGSGPDVYDRWAAGDLPWTTREIRRAFETFGRVVADGAVAGGSAGAIATSFADAGEPLFADPPGCLYMHQGSFMPTFFEAKGHRPEVDFDFYPFPEIAPEFHNTAIGAGDLFALFTDNEAGKELLAYLVSPEAQQILVSRGGALSVSRLVAEYPSDLVRREAELLTGAEHFRFDASDLMPPAMNSAFWQAILDFTADQSRLDEVLHHLEEVRGQAYG